jgi:hypothetical protein
MSKISLLYNNIQIALDTNNILLIKLFWFQKFKKSHNRFSKLYQISCVAVNIIESKDYTEI